MCRDPREGGGKLNSMSQADVVGLIMLDGTEYLHYRAPKIDVAILRGTTADMDGNVAFEKECFFADNLNQVKFVLPSRDLLGAICFELH